MAAAPGFEKHPDYEITTETVAQHYEVHFNGACIADCRQPMLLTESRHHPVYYVPKADLAMEYLTPTEHQSYCPFKGHARYWTIEVDGKRAENAVWAYDDPYDELPQIKDHVAFYADRVDAITIDGEPQPGVAPGWTDR
jgi:uncharacterized protein (DUF427 family)